MEKMLKINNKNTTVKVLKHSINRVGDQFLSIELETPRIILAELNTHKILVRNTQSSRAVPFSSVKEQLEKNPFVPSFWSKKSSGMSSREECNESIVSETIDDFRYVDRNRWWNEAMKDMLYYADHFDKSGYHKQITGRLLEPFQMIRLVLSGTEWDNFFNLRIHETAEPHFRDLAIKIYLAKINSFPERLRHGEWHLPYINTRRDLNGRLLYLDDDNNEIDLETAKKISLSCVAQTSYRKQDKSEEKADDIIEKLFGTDVVHSSPSEHIGTPMEDFYYDEHQGFYKNFKEPGVTHMDNNECFWSGQLKGWIQYRQLIPNNVCTEFDTKKFLEYTKDLDMSSYYEDMNLGFDGL